MHFPELLGRSLVGRPVRYLIEVPDDVILREAERKVADAALAWAQSQSEQAATELRSAVFMLRKARQITGKVRIDEIMRELDAAEGSSLVPGSLFIVIDVVLGPVFVSKDQLEARQRARPAQIVAEYRPFRRL